MTGESNQPFVACDCRFKAGRALDLPMSSVGLDSVRTMRLSGNTIISGSMASRNTRAADNRRVSVGCVRPGVEIRS